ncbi:TPA: acyl-CoA dehydrogenase [Candidatus Bipolaricaulota bacterium]|nr:acyl-CoA dehydrogenase [Candidatus Bipolaricaulota bacterium]
MYPIYSFFDEEHRILKRMVREFVEEELNPHVDEWEEARLVPREVFERLGELGLLGIRFPEEYGGSAADMRTTVAFVEELARCRSRGLVMGVLVHTDMSSPHLVRYGTEEQKRRWLPEIISGRKICAIAVTEPGAGSDVAGIGTTARREGDSYVLNGSKVFITNAINADLFFVLVKTAPQLGHRGMSLILVEKGTPGFTIQRMTKKLGMHGSDTGELTFEDCRVPVENLIGEENRGFYQVMSGFQVERLVSSVAMVSHSQQAIEDVIRYAKERELFGRRLIDFQVTQHKLAKLQTELEAARQLTYAAARTFDEGLDPTAIVSMCKAFCAEVACRVADECLQLHGGYGYMEDYDIARFYRDIRLWKIGAGTTEVMLEIIAKRMRLVEAEREPARVQR